jgi:16S rRNA (adenine1518-N6/adenine1519-N6)-dimethyltransferase
MWVRRELKELNIPPLKRFGQHFLLSDSTRDKLVEEAGLSRNDTVVEVGPGLGFLTSALATKAGHIIAIEKDRTLAKHLTNKFSQNQNVEVIQADALTTPFPTDAKIVSSPPYNISSKLILRILNSRFKLACLLLQEDFVRRLTASCGSRDYGRLTVMVQTRAAVKYVDHVPRSAFYPVPRVDSAIAAVHPLSDGIRPKDEGVFADLVRALFTQRRRMLRGVLSRYLTRNYGGKKDAILATVEFADKRIYELTPAEFINLSDAIAEVVK